MDCSCSSLLFSSGVTQILVEVIVVSVQPEILEMQRRDRRGVNDILMIVWIGKDVPIKQNSEQWTLSSTK
jgi:hypothetical protein